MMKSQALTFLKIGVALEKCLLITGADNYFTRSALQQLLYGYKYNVQYIVITFYTNCNCSKLCSIIILVINFFQTW